MTEKEVVELAKKYIQKKYLTKSKFAEMAGMSPQHLNNIFAGICKPTPKLLAILDLEISANIYKRKSTT